MAEFHGLFCHPFLPSVLLIEGVGGMGDGIEWEVAKTQFGIALKLPRRPHSG